MAAADSGLPVRRYEVRATFEDGVARWTFAVQTEQGKHEVPIRDGEEVPILLELCRRDWTVFFDPDTQTFRTGWNTPGNEAKH